MLGLVVALAFCLYLATSADNVEAGVANRSEIRALFVHYPTYNNNPDWDQVLQTVQDTNHNVLIMEILGNSFARYPSQLFDPSMRDHLGEAIQAGHSRGIEVHALMLVSLNPPDADPNLRQVSCDGSYNDWLDPCLPESRQLLKEAVEELVTNYDIDGFMFDYIRYNTQDASVSDACRQKFEAETGITPSNWPAEVCGGGQYNNEFMIWRIDTITELVADMRGWMIEIDPELEFSAAAFQILYENGNYYPTYTRRAVGQDPTEWIEMGLMDWVSPMGYTNDPDRYAATHSGCIQYMVGGPEGAVPIAAFTANDLNSITVSQFQQEIAKCREIGCDGWAIWRYGGPGDNSGMTPDIRDYFDGVSLPDTFSIGSVQAFVGSTDAVVSWKSDKPVDGTVEYSTTPLFVATAKTDYNYQCSCQFPYYDMEHNQGDVVTDSSLDTTHANTLLNLQPSTKYYYRIQSTDESGTATSKVYEFTTSSGTATVTITGKVTDSETGQPIEGATVSCGPNGDLTDQAGDFSIGKASTGTCTLTAEKRGYVTYSTGFDYPSSGPYTHDIPLDPQKIHIIGSLVDEQGSPVQANVTIYEQGTDNVIAEVQTDPSGSYDIPIIPDVYDVKLRLAQVSFRVSSVDSFSELRDLINGVSHTEDRTALTVDIPESEHTIQIETNMPQRVFINGSRIAAVSSLGELKRNTYFYSNGILYLKIHPDLMSDCIYECCENEQRYYDKPCGVNEYCSANNCGHLVRACSVGRLPKDLTRAVEPYDPDIALARTEGACHPGNDDAETWHTGRRMQPIRIDTAVRTLPLQIPAPV